MQLICDGARQKAEVLDTTIEEYKEVYIKARREFTTVVDVSLLAMLLRDVDEKSVNNYMHGQGAEQEALRAAARGGRGGRGARGARGAGGAGGGRAGRGGGGGAAPRRRNNDDDADEEDSDGDGGPAGGGGAVRASARPTRGRSTTTRGRGRGTAAGVGPSKRRPANDQGEFFRQGSVTFVSTTDDQASDTPECGCGNPAVPRTVTKPDSAHTGRGFWTCAKPHELVQVDRIRPNVPPRPVVLLRPAGPLPTMITTPPRRARGLGER